MIKIDILFSDDVSPDVLRSLFPHFYVMRAVIFGGKVQSAFHPVHVGEMSISVINAARVWRGCVDRQSSPGELLRKEFYCTQPGLVCASG